VKSLAEKGIWAIYESIHWGLVNTEGKKRVFKCIEQKGKDKMIKTRCPMCDLIEERKHARATKAEELEKAGASPETISAKLKLQDNWLKTFNKDSKWYVNVLKNNGEIGRLSFAHVYKKQLDIQIEKLVNPPKGKKPVDPIAAEEGVIFNFFYKKGNQKTRVQTVEVFQEEVTVKGADGEDLAVNVVKKLPLTENLLARLEDEAWDLVGMNKVLTQAEIQNLVDSNFDAALVDAYYTKATVKDNEGDDSEPDEEESSPATLPTKRAAAAEDTEEPKKAAPKAEPKKAAPAFETEAPKTTTKTQSMTDDDFFSKFGGQ
jgi:hypothetical protein